MSKTRLSKLQKWILEESITKAGIRRSHVRGFFGKEYSPRFAGKELVSPFGDIKELLQITEGEDYEKYVEKAESKTYMVWNFKKGKREAKKLERYVYKKKYVSTKAEEVSITRSLKNLIKKEMLIQPTEYGKYYLTKKGFLNAKNTASRHKTTNNKLNVKKLERLPRQVNFKTYKENIDRAVEKERAWNEPSPELSPEEIVKKTKLTMLKREFDTQFHPQAIIEVCCEECKQKIRKLAVSLGVEKIEKLVKEIKGGS